MLTSTKELRPGAGSQLEIATVLFGGLPTLHETLPTWIRAVDGTQVRLRIIDNGPTNDAEWLLRDLALGTSVEPVYSHCPENPGFAASANRLIREANSPWIFLLNPDVYLDRDAVISALEYVTNASNHAPAAVSLRTNGRLTSGISLSWYGFFLDREIPSRRYCLGPSGGAAILPVEKFRNMGWFFDEDLFAWGEDAGLAIRLFAAGVRTGGLDLRLEHVGGHSVSSQAGQRIKARLIARNRLLVLRRDFSLPFQLTVGSLMVLAMLVNGARKARVGTGRAYFSGMLEAFKVKGVPSDAKPRLGLYQFIRFRFAGPM